MDQALNSQKTPHTSPLRASYGMSFVSILMKNDRVIKGFYCTNNIQDYIKGLSSNIQRSDRVGETIFWHLFSTVCLRCGYFF